MAYIESVKLEVNDGTTRTATIIANRVVIEKEVIAKRYRTALKENRIEVAGYHLFFSLESDLFEIVSGDALDAIEIQNILDEAENDNYIYPDSSDVTKFKIIGTGDNSNLYSTTYGVRDNTDIVTATTKELLTSTDLEFFER